ncbi:MAG: translation initiation factor IF-2 [Nitrospirota bacterium]
MRVHEIAKKLNMDNKLLVSELKEMGIAIKSALSSLDEETSQQIINLHATTKTSQSVTSRSVTSEKKKKLLAFSSRVSDLANTIGIKPAELIKSLFLQGISATINQQITPEMINQISLIYNLDIEISAPKEEEEEIEEDSSLLQPRAPVVTIMGHVDHGKTKLLDTIRQTNVIDTEAGGITQHIGAYKVKVKEGEVVFLDTPGHEAFTAMRARGAQVTDVVVLVVAADDGIMPQTVEAIDHAKAANVPIVVAINKVDLPGINKEKIYKQLADNDLLTEEWGGKTICCEVSAKQKTGLDHLLEMLLLEAEMLELTANPNKKAQGTIIESRLDKGKGPVATVLVQKGTLHIGNAFVAGTSYGRVRAMFNDKGEKINSAGPSTPVEVVGFSKISQAGDSFKVVENGKKAKQICLELQEKERITVEKPLHRITLDDLYLQIKEGKVKELDVIIKADVGGSVEVLKHSFGKIGNKEVKTKVIHSGIGEVNESDIILASASNAIIISFHLPLKGDIKALAQTYGVDLRSYNIIYDVTNEVKKALEGLLEPKYKEIMLGIAEVREIFKASKIGVACGCYVKEGKISKGKNARIIRNDKLVVETRMISLRRFKEDVSDAIAGLECGIGLEKITDVQVGDIIEVYTQEKIIQKL